MSNEQNAVNVEVLNSWKEVAVYLGRGVRTVQRWEMDLGLPVRRPRGRSRSAVIALKPELDLWLSRAPKEVISKEAGFIRLSKATSHTQDLHSNTQLLVSKTKQVMQRSVGLCEQSKHLCVQIDRALALTARLAAARKPAQPGPIMETAKAAHN
jgi:hypothetical protein